MNFHCISGLPRSGSTLLAAILGQNPRLIASVESPIVPLLRSSIRTMSGEHEAAVYISDEQRQRILAGIVANYYGPVEADSTVFDSHRGWCAHLPLLGKLFSGARVVCCVRDVAWILDSMERLVRKNCLLPSRIFGFGSGTNVYARIDHLMKDGFVGNSVHALREAWFSEEARQLIVIRYESLVNQPAETIAKLYVELGLEPFCHNFTSLRFEAPELDQHIGLPGMHTVRARVEPNIRETVLPKDVFERYEHHDFWNLREYNPRGVPVL